MPLPRSGKSLRIRSSGPPTAGIVFAILRAGVRRWRPLIADVELMRQRASTFAAFLAAPLVPALLVALTQTSWGREGIAKLSFWLAAGYCVIGIYVLLLGLPAYLIARRFGLVNLWTALGTGLLIAAILSFTSLHGQVSWESASYRLPGNALIGAISAFVFWGIWRTGRRSDGK